MTSRREFLTQAAAASIAAAASLRAANAAKAEPAREKDATSGRAPQTGSLRLAIVGTGQISHRYLKQAAGHPRARFVATCARTLESAQARAAEYGIEAWFDDYTKMYETVSPDAVIIATPNALHAAPTIAALQRGIHALCEKPMATTFEDCQSMVAASTKSGAIFLSLPFDATPTFLAALDHLNEATLGPFTGAESQFLFPGPGRDNWYYDRSIAGGGAMLDTLVYPVSQLIGLLGPARSVTGFANTLIPNRKVDGGAIVESDVDDNVTLIVEWPGGQQAVLRALWGASFFRFGDTAIYGRNGTLWFAGKDVIIHSPARTIPGAEAITWNGRTNCYRIPPKTLPNVKGEGLIDHFVDCIEGRAQPTCGGQQQLHVHEILFKGYDAARSGRTQRLETTFTPWHKIDPAFHDTRSRAI